jgi:hypothetical protein
MQDLLINSSRLDSSDNDNISNNIFDNKNFKMMIRSNRYQQEQQEQQKLKQNQQKQKNFKELLLQKQNEKLKQMEFNQTNLIKERDFLLNLINKLVLKDYEKNSNTNHDDIIAYLSSNNIYSIKKNQIRLLNQDYINFIEKHFENLLFNLNNSNPYLSKSINRTSTSTSTIHSHTDEAAITNRMTSSSTDAGSSTSIFISSSSPNSSSSTHSPQMTSSPQSLTNLVLNNIRANRAARTIQTAFRVYKQKQNIDLPSVDFEHLIEPVVLNTNKEIDSTSSNHNSSETYESINVNSKGEEADEDDEDYDDDDDELYEDELEDDDEVDDRKKYRLKLIGQEQNQHQQSKRNSKFRGTNGRLVYQHEKLSNYKFYRKTPIQKVSATKFLANSINNMTTAAAIMSPNTITPKIVNSTQTLSSSKLINKQSVKNDKQTFHGRVCRQNNKNGM